MVEEKKKNRMFVIEIPDEWLERFKAIMKREQCLRYSEVFIGLIEQYEEIAREQDKKNTTAQGK